MNANHGAEDQSAEVLMVLLAIIVGVLIVGYLYDRVTVNDLLLQGARGLLFPFSALHLASARHDMTVITDLKGRSATLGPAGLYQVFSVVGGFWRWPLLVLLAVFGVWGWRVGVERYRTTLTLRKLLQFNARPDRFPCLAPVAFRYIDREPLNSGPWRAAMIPLEWCVEHDLLIDSKTGKPPRRSLFLRQSDGFVRERSPILRKSEWKGRLRLDREGAERMLKAQIDQPFQGFAKMPPHRRALAAAFLAWGHGDTQKSQNLLDRMSLSFQEPRSPGKPFVLDTRGAEDLIERHWPLGELDGEDLGPHDAFEITLLAALLGWARMRGSLPCAQFIWCRPMDRTLWYALNQVGRKAPFVEACGVWAHMDVENLVEAPVVEPDVGQALVGLERTLAKEGWLQSDEPTGHGPRNGRPRKPRSAMGKDKEVGVRIGGRGVNINDTRS